MADGDNPKTMSMVWKSIIGVGVLVSLFVGMFTVDAHFAKSDQLIAMGVEVKNHAKNKFLLAEAEAVKTFQGLQMQQEITYNTIMMNIFIMQKTSLDREDARLRRQLKLYPGTVDLKEDLERNKIDRALIQQNINKQLMIK